jgi:TonB family protein
MLPAAQTQPVRPPIPRPADAATELARLPLRRIELRPPSLEAEPPRDRTPSYALLAVPPAPSVKVEGPRPAVPEPRAIQKAAPPGPGTGDGRRPGANSTAADPAQQSDSESDAFAKIGSYNARDGKLDPQFGRKVKTVRPKLPIVGQVDAFAMGRASVTLKVNIDATGKVTKTRVHKSSGSNEIDQPCVVAMYEWWFEPLRDRAGNAVPDAVLFTITFH